MHNNMQTIVFATNNAHKLSEVRSMLDGIADVRSLADIGCHDDIPETSDSIEGNALLKAEFVLKHYGFACFADDTGLEVEALGGEPGVHSARYAGDEHDDEANKRKLLDRLKGKENRTAQFRTVIALMNKDATYTFEGIVKGHIIESARGSEGFGYDPLFVPEGYDKTFAELGAVIKNTISHRAKAVEKLVSFMKTQQQNTMCGQ